MELRSMKVNAVTKISSIVLFSVSDRDWRFKDRDGKTGTPLSLARL